jgi:hypothetical protein
MVTGAICAVIAFASNMTGNTVGAESILMESASKACLGGLIWGYLMGLLFNWYGSHISRPRHER